MATTSTDRSGDPGCRHRLRDVEACGRPGAHDVRVCDRCRSDVPVRHACRPSDVAGVNTRDRYRLCRFFRDAAEDISRCRRVHALDRQRGPAFLPARLDGTGGSADAGASPRWYDLDPPTLAAIGTETVHFDPSHGLGGVCLPGSALATTADHPVVHRLYAGPGSARRRPTSVARWSTSGSCATCSPFPTGTACGSGSI